MARAISRKIGHKRGNTIAMPKALRMHPTLASKALMAIQFVCIAMFLVDLLYEVHLAGTGDISILNPVHLVSEGLALILLLAGFALAHILLRHTRATMEDKMRQLGSLRGHFDTIIEERFHAWHLSAAESDIALLSLRGMKICEIARMRHTAEGTIKAQLSAVYRKSGIASRTELLAMFMDEFLEYSTQDGEPPQSRPIAA